EFVRAKCELARIGRSGPRARELDRRVRDLLQKYERAWFGPLVDRKSWWHFTRGLAEVRITGAKFALGLMTAIAESEIAGWVYSLWLGSLSRKDLRRIAACPFLAAPVHLRADIDHSVGAEITTLTTSPHLARLPSLALAGSYGEAVVVALAA